jgi:endonuclease/exonuclease/phosphatase family metal-dependent hydrolase
VPYYNLLKELAPADQARATRGIQALRRQKNKEIPRRTLENTLLLATWNIRDFGNEDKRAKGDLDRPGPRLPESYFYLAEVISSFDLVALQEVNTLEALQRVMLILGPSWEYLATDIKPDAGGNDERMVFVYDSRKIWFKHLTGQIVLSGEKQFVRSPFYAAFQAAWFRFSLCTVHILYGDAKDTTEREAEIDDIAGFLAQRVERTQENLILLGDFNILNRKDKTFAPLEKHGWHVPIEHASNIPQTKFYDQIAFKLSSGELQRGPSEPNAGAFDFFKSVFPVKAWEEYYTAALATGRPMASWDKTPGFPDRSRMLTRQEYYKQWRTWQMSDHLPLWIELQIDFTDDYLKVLSKKKSR